MSDGRTLNIEQYSKVSSLYLLPYLLVFPLCARTNHGQLRISRHLWSFLVSPEQIHEEVSKAPYDFHFPDHHNKYVA